jgi:hypothetical protein
MNKLTIGLIASAGLVLSAALIYFTQNREPVDAIIENSTAARDVVNWADLEPVMLSSSAPRPISAEEITQEPEITAAKKAPGGKKKQTGANLPRSKRPALPRIEAEIITPEEQRQIDESFLLLESFSDLVDDGRDIDAVLESERWLNHPNREVRLEIALSLDWIGLPAANQLARMIDDPDPEVREAAQSGFWDALSEADNPYLKADLLALAANSSDSEVRENAIEELTTLPDYLAFPILARHLNDPDEIIRQDVLDHLEFISSEEITTYEQAMIWYEANKAELFELEAEELLIPQEQ